MHGHGADSGAPFDVPLWQAVRAREGRVTWWAMFATEADALEAAWLRE
jgi:hypothetical protein